MRAIGIDDIELATTHHVVRLDDYAAANDTDPNKYRLGLGQDEFSFPAPDEDIVTMAAAAAAPIIDRCGTEGLRTLIVATESGTDQSMAAGMAVHRLLGLPSQMRIVEFKEACYSATAALQAAVGIGTRAPGQRVLVIAAEVARYELDSPGEPTQGAGAVAMLVSGDPRLVEIEPVSGLNSADVDDFWRPNDSSTAIVDGALSVSAYLDALTGAWEEFAAQGGPASDERGRVLCRRSFTTRAQRARAPRAELTGAELNTEMVAGGAAAAAADAEGSDSAAQGPRDTGLATSTLYNRRLGNSYTASLYVGLCSLLDHDEDLAGKRVGLFSYGSGSVGEFLTGRVVPGYERRSRRQAVTEALDARVPLSMADYRKLHAAELPSSED